MKISTALLLCLLLSACASTNNVKHGAIEPRQLYEPPLGEITVASLGNTMIHASTGWHVDCITPLISRVDTWAAGMYSWQIRGGVTICGDSMGTNTFIPDYELATSNTVMNARVVETIKSDGSSDLCYEALTDYCINYKRGEILRSTKFVAKPQTSQKSIEYMGVNDQIAQFVYVTSDDSYRTARREFVVDLNKGNILNFKGAQVEIIEATNTEITYIVKTYFD